MRALTYDRYGGLDVLEARDLPRLDAPSGTFRIRVRAAALNPKDSLVRKGKFTALSGRKFPKFVGVDFAGETESGERVYGALEEIRYLGGTIADEVIVGAHEFAAIPPSLTFEEAACLPLAGLTALQAIRDLGKIGPGMRVGISGASGGVGTLAIQIAKALGAHVTTTSSAGNLALCRELGADDARDRATMTLAGAKLDLLFDVFGNLQFRSSLAALAPTGSFVSTVPSARILLDAARTVLSPQRAKLVVVRSRRADLETLAGMVARGALRPVIDRIEPFSRAKEAIAHLETKRARGKIVVRMGA